MADLFGETEQNAAAFLRSGRRPRAFFECSLGGSDGAIHVIGICIGHLGDDFFGRGIVNGEGFVRFAGDPFAVDEHLYVLTSV